MTVIIPKSLHMKTYVGFFLILILGFYCSADSKEGFTPELSPQFLDTHDEVSTAWIDKGFTKLKLNEQRQLLHELQVILAGLNGTAELLSQNPSLKVIPILTSFFLTSCFAASESDFRDSVRTTESKSTTWTGASQENALMFKKTGNIKYATSALSNLIAEAHRLQGRRSGSEQLALNSQFTQTKLELIAEAKKHGVLSSISTMMYNQESIFQRITGGTIEKSQIASTSQTAPTKIKAARADDSSACLYAGFVIQGAVCQAPRQLPNDSQLRDYLNVDKFKCESAQVLCNPLIFGYEGSSCKEAKNNKDLRSCLKDAKPVCIANTVSATLRCKEKTNSERYSENALSLVIVAPSMLRKLVTDSLRLCDEKGLSQNRMISKNANGSNRKNSEKIRNDIQQTCAVARPQIISLLKTYEGLYSGGKKSSNLTEGAGSRK